MTDARIDRIDEPEAGGMALLIIDIAFKGEEGLRPVVRKAADAIVGLRAQADAAGVPVVYAYDNLAERQSDREHRARTGWALEIIRNSMSAEAHSTNGLALEERLAATR